jgi:hypothetical protein
MILIGKLGPGKKGHVGKYSFVNRTIKPWNQLPAEALATVSCKSHIVRKMFRRVITSEVKRRNLKWGEEVKNGQ